MDFMSPSQMDGRRGGTSCGCHAGTGHSSCNHGEWGLTGYPLAMVYSSCQAFGELYDAQKALKRGTLFKELDLPFEGEGNGSCRKGCCR